MHRRRRHRQEVLNKVEAKLKNLRPIDSRQGTDLSLWRGKGGNFTSRFSSKETWDQVREVIQAKEWYKGVWFPNATPKYSFIVWLAAHDRLTTGDRMLAWNVGADPKCVFCQTPTETRDHIFFSCPFSSQIWDWLTRKLLDSRYTCRFTDILLILSGSILKGTSRFLMRYVFQVSIHTIWRERNRRRHGEMHTQVSSLRKTIDRIVRNRLSSLRAPLST